jgi:hypothetical protein
MEQSCPKFNELSSILDDRNKDAARPYNTGQGSKVLVPYHAPKTRNIPFPTEEETTLVSEPIPVSSPLIVTNRPSTSSIRTHKGKKRTIDDVILDTNPERPSQVAKIDEMYVKGSLEILEKESKARVMIKHIERSGKENGLCYEDIRKNVREAVDSIYSIHN